MTKVSYHYCVMLLWENQTHLTSLPLCRPMLFNALSRGSSTLGQGMTLSTFDTLLPAEISGKRSLISCILLQLVERPVVVMMLLFESNPSKRTSRL